MTNKTTENEKLNREKSGDRDQVSSALPNDLGHTEQIGHDEERYRRNQEWSPTQDTGYQTGGGPHSDEDAEAASKTADSAS